MFDETGDALGRVRLAGNFDITGPAGASGFAIGYGNYGGVYREGAIALSRAPAGEAAGDAAPGVAAPWTGVETALGLAGFIRVDPRDPAPAAEPVEGLDISPSLP